MTTNPSTRAFPTREPHRQGDVIPFPNTGPTDDADIPSAPLPVPPPTLRIPGLRAMFDREVQRLRELDQANPDVSAS